MPTKRDKVVVAMSGGVDSSVAACLLVEQGYDVVGLFMRVGAQERVAGSSPHGPQRAAGFPPDSSGPGRGPTADETVLNDTSRSHRGCCSASDASDARFVAGKLGIPFYALNFHEDFDRIIDYFADEYVRGRTPNPCVVCNDRLKFGKLVDYANAVGARYIATGHYARIGLRGEGSKDETPHGLKPAARRVLMRAHDRQKDQSYVLFGLSRTILDRLMFPIGDCTKAQVRELAARFDLPNRDKPDSVEICFVPDRDYARVVRERRPDAFASGDVVNSAGEVIGRHKGIGCYTIGQRRGLGIAAGRPIYVTRLSVLDNTVTVGDGDELLSNGLIGDEVNYLLDVPDEPFRAEVKIRYLHTAAPAIVHPLSDNKVRVVFDRPQRAITPGQAVVFYDGDTVLGGAWINRAQM
ncbi:MAG: tRNA 2-thiouridine(34) synthase MnmA [Planctomycetota bacterium]|jgi:tRNA-specific 2-thiouridylase